jgi:hypothetical protein
MPSLSRKKITIKKMGGVVPIPAPAAIPVPAPPPPPAPLPPPPPPVTAGRKRTFPKGILRKTQRILPTRDPTSSRRKTMRIMTSLGQKKLRSTVRVRSYDDKTIRKHLLDKKLISSDSKANTGLLRKMYEEAVGAGLLKIDSK